jgi:similar to spore coat protein
MELKQFAPNETIQLHELLTFKNLCLTKSVTMTPLVYDDELKAIMKQDADITYKHINELKSLMEESNISDSKK